MASPGTVLIGVIGMMFGVLLVYAGIKNKSVFGKNGILPTVLSKGTLAKLDDIPPMWTDVPVGKRI